MNEEDRALQWARWRKTMTMLRSAAKKSNEHVMLDTARIDMAEMMDTITNLRRQVRDLEELLAREEARA